MKFLHIADVHLGCTRYQLPESPRDFFDAWIDVLTRYGIGENVDFVLIAGDFFHKRSVPPETMNYAVEGLTLMKNAGIPVIAIEGNHDQKHTDSEFSWLRSLSRWGLVKLLEPEMAEGQMAYSAWDESSKSGGFLDIGGTRIFGSNWYGASGNFAIRMLTDALKQNLRSGAFHILMLHTDVEGHQMHPLPALSVASLKELKQAVQYVALGHTHKHYEIDNWAFNPGSIEITNISEFRETRGAFVVEVDEVGNINVRHVTDYHFRPFQRLGFDVSNSKDPADVTAGVLDKVRSEARVSHFDTSRPIIEIGLRGQLGFPNSLLETQIIRDETKTLTDALHVRIKNHTVPADYLETTAEVDDEGRERLERRVIDDLIARDTRYSIRQEEISEAVIGAKRMALTEEPAEKIAEFIGAKNMSEILERVEGITQIPLFPLPLVMLPNELLPLHVFEERYRQMIRDVEHGSKYFGILLFEPDGFSDDRPPVGRVGCVAELRQSELLPDGRSNILTLGLVRFRLLDYVETEKLYFVGEVEFFVDKKEDADQLGPLADDVFGLFERMAKAAFSMSANRGQFPEIQKTDPESLSFLITAAFNFDNEKKYSLLELTSTADRLTQLKELLGSTVGKMEESAETLAVAKLNGHGKKKVDL